MIAYCELTRDELPRIWSIDRSELIARIYVVKDGELVLEELNFEVPGWPPGEPERHAAEFEEQFASGAWFMGAWDDDVLAGIAVLDRRPLESQQGAVQLSFLHVSRPYRGTGVGVELFERARREAALAGAPAMYISATESEHTVQFYFARGCRLNPNPDARLFDLEPRDIHLLAPTVTDQRLP